ncbi:hypothetical protein Gohar_002573 [Gossypium harknessii]|uniref:Uncharacterized protein n=1 Tax=Gossypium harknessii TaxID=34285 RepID=A0A7J9HLB3_9ROSI|nr:hypothetical protein [Gossypium harknessii]
MRSTMANLWHPVKRIQISDLGEKRRMGMGVKGGIIMGARNLLRCDGRADGKKRPKREEDKSKVVDELGIWGKLTGCNENHLLECLWIGESTGCKKTLIYVEMERVRRSYVFFNGIDIQTIGSRGGLCLAWKDDVKIGLRNFSNSHINVDVIEDEIGSQWRLNGFYGSPYAHNKEDS